MHSVVLVKQVPDPAGERELDRRDATVARDAADAVVGPLDLHALEAALTLRERAGGTVTALTVGPPRAAGALRHALATGADRAVHVVDPALHGACAPQTSAVLAAALRRVGFDLVLCGAASSDGRLGVMAALLGERLGVPHLSGLRALAVSGTTVTGERQTEDGWWELAAELPAVVSTHALPDPPRRRTVAGIRAAQHRPVTTLTLTDLGIDPATVGLAAATSRVVTADAGPARTPGRTGDPAELVRFLADRALV
ncbi:electron transfer flavoprotein subunit beta/FixA family protein [Modestobacter sp. VKM Ac-2986]|uniref:electron transfer flavoprotein subunit beta/FixA family protein n=1 Tax=Modestobacter sp. VKM Ac-2986 TaxID=3004140 RepID=UPI0022AB8D50|nr:electron transfer flavoprotein subunit beta/FixA family protein [Modestobacter sp. VKM Ac-2986]MCZ2829538.1 electron transfer flavoprotein subunit beta/FixA family protein [Modestobacter sp. VKM Ac-2986]